MMPDMSTSFGQPTPQMLGAGATVAPFWAALRYTLLAVFVAVAVGILTTGIRPGSFFELARSIQEGRVTQVTVSNALRPGSTGTALAEIRWHDGFLPRYTEVRQFVPGDDGPNYTGGSALQEITGDIGTHLNQYSSAPLVVTQAPDRTGVQWTLLGWRVPAWVGILGIVAALGTIGLLISGPQTLMATKWAWFWALSSVVGFAATPVFLLWGIPRTGEVEQPYTRQGRLTGGWAFILFSVVAASAFPGLRPGG